MGKAPTAAFTPPPGSSFDKGETITFDAGDANDDGDLIGSLVGIQKYEWDFDADDDDLSLEESTEPTITYAYLQPGAHRVRLRVTDVEGDTGEVTQPVTVVNRLPDEPSFVVVPASLGKGVEATFTASASDPDGSIVEYRWDFDGDGTVDQALDSPEAAHTFSTAGEHTVTLVVEDDDGATASVSQPVTVLNRRPAAAFSFEPMDPIPGEDVHFDAAATEETDAAISDYSWDFDGDGEEDAANVEADYTFEKPGKHEVTLIVTDVAGGIDTVTHTVDVNAPPVVDFFADQDPVGVGQEAYFMAYGAPDAGEFFFGDGDPDGTVVKYVWDFGDGEDVVATEEPWTTHVFEEAGTYHATLEVTDDRGATGTATYELLVEWLPEARFTLSPTTPVVGDEVTFDGSSSSDRDGTVVEYYWFVEGADESNYDEFDGGEGEVWRHVFGVTGTYDAYLLVVDDQGGWGSASSTFTASEKPSPSSETPPGPAPSIDPSSAQQHGSSTEPVFGQGVVLEETKSVAPVTISTRVADVSRTGSTTVRFGCPVGDTRCAGVATLEFRGSGAHGRAVVLGKAPFTISPGQNGAVKVKLSPKARKLLKRRGRLRVRLVVHQVAPGTLGPTVQKTITLRSSRR